MYELFLRVVAGGVRVEHLAESVAKACSHTAGADRRASTGGKPGVARRGVEAEVVSEKETSAGCQARE